MTMDAITVTADRWEGGWELSLEGEVVTQVAVLDRAQQQVRDYLDTIDPDTDHQNTVVAVIPNLGALTDRVRQAREATQDAVQAQNRAAREAREVVRQLRAAHISVSDAAAILGVSRGRVSQLAKR